jgi:hypothetical protein
VAVRGPGIASTQRARRGALARLVDRASEHSDALDALVFAYGLLPRPRRWALAHAIVRDGASPTTALAALLVAEKDATLRRRLAELLRAHVEIGRCAWLRGTPTCGEACLSHWLEGRAETLRASWSSGQIEHLEIETSHRPSFSEEQPGQDAIEVIETLTPLLWRYIRRGGPLPQGIDRFAGFFSLGRAGAQ